jgi:hypothetical protein
MNIGEFYKRKGEVRTALYKEFRDGFMLIVSVGTPSNNQVDGVTMQVTVDTGADMIVRGNGRQPSPQETAAWKAYQQSESERIQGVEASKITKELKVTAVVDPGPQKPQGR